MIFGIIAGIIGIGIATKQYKQQKKNSQLIEDNARKQEQVSKDYITAGNEQAEAELEISKYHVDRLRRQAGYEDLNIKILEKNRRDLSDNFGEQAIDLGVETGEIISNFSSVTSASGLSADSASYKAAIVTGRRRHRRNLKRLGKSFAQADYGIRIKQFEARNRKAELIKDAELTERHAQLNAEQIKRAAKLNAISTSLQAANTRIQSKAADISALNSVVSGINSGIQLGDAIKNYSANNSNSFLGRLF